MVGFVSPIKAAERSNMCEFEFIDISMPITADMPVYKGKAEKRPIINRVSGFDQGTIYESKIEMNLHTGTHLDSQHHMMADGEWIGALDLQDFYTNCRVIDCLNVKECITKKDLLNKEIKKGEFILLKTRNSTEDILEKDFVFLEKSGAKYLADMEIKGIGTDGLGIERSQPEHETHLTLMEKGIHILEGLRLGYVEEGEYILSAFPIYIPGAEASPVRAVLMKEK